MKSNRWLTLLVSLLFCAIQVGVSAGQDQKNASKLEPVNDELVLQNQKLEALVYRATGSIVAGSTYVSVKQGEVTFAAGKIIRLLPGFKIEKGTKFHAYIDPGLSGSTKLVKAKGVQTETEHNDVIVNEGNPEILVQNLEKSITELLPTDYGLFQNYPNPFNPETEIRFQLPEASYVVLKIFNTLGEEIRLLADRQYEAGYHHLRWDGTDHKGNAVPSGTYFYQLQAGDFKQVKKMSLLR